MSGLTIRWTRRVCVLHAAHGVQASAVTNTAAVTLPRVEYYAGARQCCVVSKVRPTTTSRTSTR